MPGPGVEPGSAACQADVLTTTLPRLPINTAYTHQGWGQVQLVKYSNTSSTRNQVQVQVLCIFTNQVLKYIKY